MCNFSSEFAAFVRQSLKGQTLEGKWIVEIETGTAMLVLRNGDKVHDIPIEKDIIVVWKDDKPVYVSFVHEGRLSVTKVTPPAPSELAKQFVAKLALVTPVAQAEPALAVDEKKEEEKVEELTFLDGDRVVIAKLAEHLGKQPEETVLSDGRKVTGMSWKPSDLLEVEAAVKPVSARGGNFLIDGIMPQWGVVSVVHALHPGSVSVIDPKVEGGKVTPFGKTPTGNGSGGLSFTVTPQAEGVKVEYGSDTPLDLNGLEAVVPPATQQGKPVFLSGRTATWAVVQISMAYAHYAPAVYLFQPGLGWVCAITHNPAHVLGTVVKELTETTIPVETETPKKVELAENNSIPQTREEMETLFGEWYQTWREEAKRKGVRFDPPGVGNGLFVSFLFDAYKLGAIELKAKS